MIFCILILYPVALLNLLISFNTCLWIPCVCVCVCVLVTQLCLTLCNPMDCSPPGSSVHVILQARTLAWVAISFSRIP